MRAKYSPRPLPLSCGVCGAGAADVQHYGSVACYSCRSDNQTNIIFIIIIIIITIIHYILSPPS